MFYRDGTIPENCTVRQESRSYSGLHFPAAQHHEAESRADPTVCSDVATGLICTR